MDEKNPITLEPSQPSSGTDSVVMRKKMSAIERVVLLIVFAAIVITVFILLTRTPNEVPENVVTPLDTSASDRNYVLPTIDPEQAAKAQQLQSVRATLLTYSDSTLTIEIEGQVVDLFLTENTMYTTGADYVDGSKNSVAAGMNVSIIYSADTREVENLWYP